MKAFNQMTPEERRKVVNQARADMQKNQREGRNMERLQAEDEKVFESVVEKGLSAYYQDASAETKMDLAPLMEEMQQRMEGPDHWIIYAEVEQGNVSDTEASTAVHHRKVGNHY